MYIYWLTIGTFSTLNPFQECIASNKAIIQEVPVKVANNRTKSNKGGKGKKEKPIRFSRQNFLLNKDALIQLQVRHIASEFYCVVFIDTYH